jgi:hypothetical protein
MKYWKNVFIYIKYMYIKNIFIYIKSIYLNSPMVWKVGAYLPPIYTHLKIEDCEGTQIVQPHWIIWPLTEKDNLVATFSKK